LADPPLFILRGPKYARLTQIKISPVNASQKISAYRIFFRQMLRRDASSLLSIAYPREPLTVQFPGGNLIAS
jgi:hypothetical protein